MKTQEQLKIFSKQYQFYKEICEDLQLQENSEVDSLSKQVRKMNQTEKD